MNAKEFISKVPVPICGLSLGLASLDRFLWYVYPDIYKFNVFALFAFIIAILFTLRIITDHKGILKDIQTPAVFGVLPTYTMTLMLLSAYIKDHIGGISGDVAFAIWISAIAASYVFMIFFIKKAFFNFDMAKVTPGWIVIFVGYVVASVTSPSFNAEDIGKVLFWSGTICYLSLLPLLVYRTVVVRKMPESLVPQIAIFAAPVNLCVAGCLAAYGMIPEGIAGIVLQILAVMGIISFVAVVAYLPIMLNRKFYPSFAALTFPLVISAVAFYRLGEAYGSSQLFDIFQTFALVTATLVVVYVLVRYTIFFYAAAKKV